MNVRSLHLALAAVGMTAALAVRPAEATEGRTKRTISYQNQSDLFYNFYEGPEPSGQTAAMYISPVPVPAHVGHTYTTYQPFMPHEYLYRHTRTHYTYHPCGGWTRSKIRYRTGGLWIDHIMEQLKCPFCN